MISIFISSCGIYSFNGASISKNTKTITIKYFTNNASTIQPILSQVITEKLKDYFTQQTNLSINDNDGDLKFSGVITKYEIKPMAIQSNEVAGKNRLTIAVKVDFTNIYENEYNFSHTFSRYRDYESSQNFSEIEEILIEEISNELIEDIFNKSVVNW
ncbi:MAG: LPS assembly lipoprotein LptE [Flavobacteriales bacterium]